MAAALASAAALWFTVAPRGKTVDVVTVRQGPLAQSIVATGRIAGPARVEIGAQASGIAAEVPVREGDTVAAGALLVRLKDDDARAAVVQARATLDAARERLRQVESAGRSGARAQRLQAESNLRVAAAEAERAERLVQDGFYSQSRADDAARTLTNARAAHEAAQAQDAAYRPDGAETLAARANMAAAQAALDAAHARLAQLHLTAPAEARVLFRRVEPGDAVSAGKGLITLDTAGALRVICQIDEKNLRHLALGQAARVSADAYPGQPFDARVQYIGPAVDTQRGTVEVRLAVPQAPAFLRADMTASVDIAVGQRAEALAVPADAVRDAERGSPWVLVLREGKAERQAVTLGLRGVGMLEVTGGLRPGDRVITALTGVSAGDRVRAAETTPAAETGAR